LTPIRMTIGKQTPNKL